MFTPVLMDKARVYIRHFLYILVHPQLFLQSMNQFVLSFKPSYEFELLEIVSLKKSVKIISI